MGKVFERVKEMQKAEYIESEAKQRYLHDAEFKVAVDYTVRVSIPDELRKGGHVALLVALEEQAIASASMAIVTFEKMFGGKT